MKREINKKPFNEDTIKRNGKWVNVGKDGKANSGKFRTKKAADAQRRAMFVNGYKSESYNAKGYSAVPGRDREVSDEGLQRVLDIAKKVDPEAKCDFDDDLIYHDKAWWILLNGDERVYDSDSYNSAYDKLLRDVEKAINDAADKYWDEVKARRDFFFDDDDEDDFDSDDDYTGYDESLITEAPDMFGLPTDDELEVEYRKRKDGVAKQREKAQAKYDSAKSLPVSKIIDKSSKSFTKDAAIKRALLDIAASHGLDAKQTFTNYFNFYNNSILISSNEKLDNDTFHPSYNIISSVGLGLYYGIIHIESYIKMKDYTHTSKLEDISREVSSSLTIEELLKLVKSDVEYIQKRFEEVKHVVESSADSKETSNQYSYNSRKDFFDAVSSIRSMFKINESYSDDWSDTLETGGEPTYCPVCGVRFMTVDDGYKICPECHKTPHEIAQLKKREFIYDDEPYNLKTGIDVGEKK